MRFAYDPYSVSVSIDEGDTCVLQIENRKAYVDILSDLYMLIKYGEGEAMLFDGENSVDFKKYTDLILEPFSLDLNNKRIKSQLYQSIINNVQDDFYSQYVDICNNIQGFISEITEAVPYSVSFECRFGIEELLKLCNVAMDYPCDSIAERLSVYIKLLSGACKINTFFIVDIERFTNLQELSEIIKMSRYDKINLVLISSEKINGLQNEVVTYILDESLCFWKAENT